MIGNFLLSELFGSNACIAKCSVKFTGSSTESLTMDFALLDRKTRLGGDMAQLKHQMFPPRALKEAGMDQQIFIMRPDLKRTYCIYPRLKSFVTRALADEEAAEEPRIAKAELGREVVDGHPCVKNKIVITTHGSEKREALVWTASDLNNFPLRMQTTEKGSTASFTFKHIRFTKPDAKQFEPPADFTAYDDVGKLIEAVAKTEGARKR
jgi:hypothetical protein